MVIDPNAQALLAGATGAPSTDPSGTLDPVAAPAPGSPAAQLVALGYPQRPATAPAAPAAPAAVAAPSADPWATGDPAAPVNFSRDTATGAAKYAAANPEKAAAPAGWARSLLAGALGVMSGLGAAPASPYGGALSGAISAQKNINAQKLAADEQAKKDAQQKFQNQTEQEKNDELHQHNIMDMYHQMFELDRDKNALLDKTSAAGSIITGDLRNGNFEQGDSGVSAAEGKAEWKPGGKYDPAKWFPVQDGSKMEMEKQPDGSSQMERVPTLTFFNRQTDKPVAISANTADYLKKYGQPVPEDSTIPIDTYLSLMGSARAAEVSQDALDKSAAARGDAAAKAAKAADLTATSTARTAWLRQHPDDGELAMYRGISQLVGDDGKPTPAAEAAARIDQGFSEEDRLKDADITSKKVADALKNDPLSGYAKPGALDSTEKAIAAKASMANLPDDTSAQDKVRAARITGTANAIISANQANEKQKQAATQAAKDGDPKDGGRMLYDGTAYPSALLSARNSSYATAATHEAERLNQIDRARDPSIPVWTLGQAQSQEKIAGNQANVNFFGSANSLIDKDTGTLDLLGAIHAKLKNGDFPKFNSLKDLVNYHTGDPALSAYKLAVLGVADDYAKVAGGGTGAITFVDGVVHDLTYGLNNNQLDSALAAVRGSVTSQVVSRMRSNPYLESMYRSDSITPEMIHPLKTAAPAPAAAAVVPAGASNEYFVNGKLAGHIVGNKAVPLGQ